MNLFFDTKPAWIDALRAWAAAEPYIARVWLFASRVTGRRRRKESTNEEPDLDVAYEMAGADPGELLAISIILSDQWRRHLATAIPVAVDLQQAELDDLVVMPAALEHGVLIYDRFVS